MAAAVNLEQRLDEVFATSPAAFVATREALVRDLRKDGRREDAASVHALRRPTIAVWGINQMARSRGDRLAALLAAGVEVERFQRAGPDTRHQLRAATRTRRALLDELTEFAASLTERPDAVRASIAATLDVASLDGELQDDLVRGRLAAELAPAVRLLGDVDDARTSRPRARAAKPAPPHDELAARRAAATLADARTHAEEAADELRDADTGVHDAQDQLDAAHRRVADLEEALADARRAVSDAKRQVTEAARVQTRARAAQRRADAALRVAERGAEEADA